MDGTKQTTNANKSTDEKSTNENKSDLNIKSDVRDILNKIFTKQALMLVVWFLAIYYLFYSIIRFFVRRNEDPSIKNSAARMLDIIVLLATLAYLLIAFFIHT